MYVKTFLRCRGALTDTLLRFTPHPSPSGNSEYQESSSPPISAGS